MNASESTLLVAGPVGVIDVLIDRPLEPPRGLAIVAHPHPLFGGTRDNKVVQTLVRALLGLGYVCWRPNFRGVGATAGSYDEGMGETDDLLAVVAAARSAQTHGPNAPLILAGFSFGAFVQTRVARHLAQAGTPANRLVLVGVATSRFTVETVPADTLVIHGELDDTVPLASVLDWARPHDLPVVVMPGADHFFHRKLTHLKQLLMRSLGNT